MKQFKNLKDPEVYDQCEQWWIDEFNKRFQGDFNINYLNMYYNNSKKFRAGNPIFCVENKTKAVRILQTDDEEGVFGYLTYDLNNIAELVISIEFTRDNTDQAFTWIKDWFDNNLTDKDLQDHFNNQQL